MSFVSRSLHAPLKVSFPSPKRRSPNHHLARAAREVVIWRPSLGMKLFLPTPQGISQAALRVGDSGGPLVVVINGLVFQCSHKLRMQ